MPLPHESGKVGVRRQQELWGTLSPHPGCGTSRWEDRKVYQSHEVGAIQAPFLTYWLHGQYTQQPSHGIGHVPMANARSVNLLALSERKEGFGGGKNTPLEGKVSRKACYQ